MNEGIMYRPLEDLLRIIRAGAEITVDGTRPMDELLRLAQAASAGASKLIIAESEYKTADDLVRIAEAGKGKIVFLCGEISRE